MPELPRSRRFWRWVLAGLAGAWIASVGLFLAGVTPYPWGWLVGLVLIGWTVHRLRALGD